MNRDGGSFDWSRFVSFPLEQFETGTLYERLKTYFDCNWLGGYCGNYSTNTSSLSITGREDRLFYRLFTIGTYFPRGELYFYQGNEAEVDFLSVPLLKKAYVFKEGGSEVGLHFVPFHETVLVGGKRVSFKEVLHDYARYSEEREGGVSSTKKSSWGFRETYPLRRA